MSASEPTDEGRARRLILAASGVLRAAEPGDAAWQIRVHELARLLERAARVDPNAPIGELVDAPPNVVNLAERR
ncbi:MAG: hypothetical protein GVY27_09995 [Deinococcus-Thermus bacterium]|jgi:hypothetical protein|nr:hypothetical protein [Deinococcota bacterium]